MLSIPLIKFRKRRGRIKPRTTTQAPPAALTLIAADFADIDPPWAALEFDRPINVDGFDGSSIVVITSSGRYDGTGGCIATGPATMQITLNPIAGPGGSGVTLSASAANGIVAADDGGAWAGVSDLELPFP